MKKPRNSGFQGVLKAAFIIGGRGARALPCGGRGRLKRSGVLNMGAERGFSIGGEKIDYICENERRRSGGLLEDKFEIGVSQYRAGPVGRPRRLRLRTLSANFKYYEVKARLQAFVKGAVISRRI